MPRADARQPTLDLAPPSRPAPAAAQPGQLALLPGTEGNLLPGESAHLLTPRELSRRFRRPWPAQRLLTPRDLLQRFGQAADARLMTPAQLLQRFGRA